MGRWISNNKRLRENIIISANICGSSEVLDWCRKDGSQTKLTKNQIIEAVDSQLKRLQTDYIDILNFQWPERYVPMYGQSGYDSNLERIQSSTILEQLEVVDTLIKSGKVRYFGLSNETPYGIGLISGISETLNLPKPVTLQSPFNLLEKNDYYTGIHEAISANNSDIGFIAYSPLAGGALTGKYINFIDYNEEDRLIKYVGYMNRYISAASEEATIEYKKISEDYGIPFSCLALAYVNSRPFVLSTLLGVTNIEQLETNLLALNIAPFPQDLESRLAEVGKKFIDPTKGPHYLSSPYGKIQDVNNDPWGIKFAEMEPEIEKVFREKLERETNIEDGLN